LTEVRFADVRSPSATEQLCPELLSRKTLLLARGVVHWMEHPEKRWVTWVMAVAFVLAMGLPVPDF